MQRPHPQRGIAQYARWALPWICVLALSTGLASAMTIALAGTSIAPESCYPNVVRLQYVGLNSWIPAENPTRPHGSH